MGISVHRKFYEENILGFYDYLYKYLITLTRDVSLAQDLVQDTMLKAWEKIDLVANYEDLKNALRTMAENLAKNHFRKYPSAQVPLPLNGEMEITASEEDCIRAILKKEERMEIYQMIDQLRNDYARILVLYYFYDVPLVRIAEVLDTSYNTIVSWHRRALKQLSDLMIERHETLLGDGTNGSATII